MSRVTSLRLFADLKELRGLCLQIHLSEGLVRYQTASFGRLQIRFPVATISVVRTADENILGVAALSTQSSLTGFERASCLIQKQATGGPLNCPPHRCLQRRSRY